MTEKPLRKEVKVDIDSRMGHAQQDFSTKNNIPRKDVGDGAASGEYKRKEATVDLPDGYNKVNGENSKDLEDSY